MRFLRPICDPVVVNQRTNFLQVASNPELPAQEMRHELRTIGPRIGLCKFH
jgi:hypothetical protein